MEINKEDSQVMVLVGNVMKMNGDNEQAKTYFKEALQNNPAEVSALICLGNDAFEKQNY
jgi:cytochrome c-type biogenesis protein CcmH/NrfG